MSRIAMILVLGTILACGKGRDDAPGATPGPTAPSAAPGAAPEADAAPSASAAAGADTTPPADGAAPVRASAISIVMIEGVSEDGYAGVSVSLEAELVKDTDHALPRLALAVACRVGEVIERQSTAIILPRAGERRQMSHVFWQDEPLEVLPSACEAIAGFAEGDAKGRVGPVIPLGVACLDAGTLTDRPCKTGLAPSFD